MKPSQRGSSRLSFAGDARYGLFRSRFSFYCVMFMLGCLYRCCSNLSIMSASPCLDHFAVQVHAGVDPNDPDICSVVCYAFSSPWPVLACAVMFSVFARGVCYFCSPIMAPCHISLACSCCLRTCISRCPSS